MRLRRNISTAPACSSTTGTPFITRNTGTGSSRGDRTGDGQRSKRRWMDVRAQEWKCKRAMVDQAKQNYRYSYCYWDRSLGWSAGETHSRWTSVTYTDPMFRRRTKTETHSWMSASSVVSLIAALLSIAVVVATDSTEFTAFASPRNVRSGHGGKLHIDQRRRRGVQLSTPPPTMSDVAIASTDVLLATPIQPLLLETGVPATLAPTVSKAPSGNPTTAPSTAPSVSASPTRSSAPSTRPSVAPSQQPTVSSAPSPLPSQPPTLFPTVSSAPSGSPSNQPSAKPSVSASPTQSAAPSGQPSDTPSKQPVVITLSPSFIPTQTDFVIIPFSGRLLKEAAAVAAQRVTGSRLAGHVEEGSAVKTEAMEDTTSAQDTSATNEPTATPSLSTDAPSSSDLSVQEMALIDGDEGDDPNDDTNDPNTEEPTAEPEGDDTSVDTMEPTVSLQSTDPPVEQPQTQPPVEGSAPTDPPIDESPTGEVTSAPTPVIVDEGTPSPTAMPISTPEPSDPLETPEEPPPFSGENASCDAYPVCAGLEGDCCPRPDGKVLECCFLTNAPVATIPITNAPGTLDPTPSPTPRITAFPVDDPTDPPVTVATEEPTQPKLTTLSPVVVVVPTGTPKRQPSLRPSPLPNMDVPTASPSSARTTRPTSAPTTLSPTETPSSRPTVSLAPTQSPMPSAAPTASFEYDKTSLNVSGVTMNLERGASQRRLQDDRDTSNDGLNCTQLWYDNVSQRIKSEVESVIPRFEMVRVSLFNLSSSIDDSTLLSMAFDVLIEIRSAVTDHDIDRYIEGPFDTAVEQTSFTDSLRLSGCPEFQNVTAVEVVVPKTTVQASTERGVNSAGLIAGIAMAISAIMLAGVAFILMRLRNKGGLYDDDIDPIVKVVENANNDRPAHFDFASEIDGIHTNTDISTLGDPIPAGTSQHNDGDQSTIGSVTLEYDFKKAFMDAQSVTDSQLGDAPSLDGTTPQRSVTAMLDDPSLTSDIITTAGDGFGSAFGGEEQFDIVAPAGLLGLILESNPEDGRPTVNIIKPTSVLAYVVNIGDRVVSVDGQNVSTMRASDVSRLIASKKDQARVIAFSRPSNRSTFRIQEDGNEGE